MFIIAPHLSRKRTCEKPWHCWFVKASQVQTYLPIKITYSHKNKSKLVWVVVF